MRIPLVDLQRQYDGIREDVWARMKEVVDHQDFILGKNVSELESRLADYLSVTETVGVASGTDALFLSLRALDIGPGDEVVTSPFTFFATAGAISNTGARPVFADIEPKTFNLDPGKLEEALGDRTRAIIPVHLFGHPADMASILHLARQKDIRVLADAAQAIGARYELEAAEMAVGAIADVAAFSFFPTKNLGCYGDGGLVATNSPKLASRIRKLRIHGRRRGDYLHEIVGTNSRLDEMQAGVLLSKLPHLEEWNQGRRQVADLYDDALGPLEDAGHLSLPYEENRATSVYNQYTIRANDRDDLKVFLSDRGIGTKVYYPVPLHLQECFEGLGYTEGDFPVAERACREVLSLPIYPELREAEINRIVQSICEFYGH